MKANRTLSVKESAQKLRMFLIPCSCGASIAVADDYDRRGMHIPSFIPCPKCGKRTTRAIAY